MEVRPGYKQTDVGIIPEEWAVKPLGECLETHPSYGINAAAVPYSERLPAYVRITDITDDGRYLPEPRVSVRSELSHNYFLEDGDIVLARTGASVGKSYRYRPNDGRLVYAGFLIRVRPNREKLLPSFAAAYATTGSYWRWVRLMSMRSGQPGINGNEFSQLPIPLPPASEQRAIAEALSDVDALLKGLERLIDKKRDLKQAAMQQLLTGQTRLPGFHGEWKVKQARKIGVFRGGSGFPLNSQGKTSGTYPFFKVSDMNRAGNETFMTTANHWISERTRKRLAATAFPTESIVFAKVGAAIFLERKKILAQPSCIDNNMAAFVLDKREADVRFVHALLLNSKLGDLVATTALPALNGKQLGDIVLPVPPLLEQTAIATVLSDMDDELSALEARRDKTRALKQAMMQELLTGRTRLV